MAREFVVELGVPGGARWLDVGCGTGALTQAILDLANPAEAVGVDPSPEFIEYARGELPTRFEVAGAEELPFADGSFDAVVSGLVLNFVGDQRRAAHEAARVATSGGTVAAYVWDYAGRMELIRRFWDAAVELDPEAEQLDEGRRFAICAPEPLSELFEGAGLDDVTVRAIEVPTVFRDFDDLWSPFLGGNAPAPAYAASLDRDRLAALREQLRSSLPIAPDGSIALVARAWAVSGAATRHAARRA